MKHYETMFILKPTLTPEESAAKIGFFKEIITKDGGEIVAVEDWGTKQLAYEIEGNKRGYYYVMYFKASPDSILELERNYRINEDIIRFIVLKYEKKKEVEAWQDMVNKAVAKPKKEEAAKAE